MAVGLALLLGLAGPLARWTEARALLPPLPELTTLETPSPEAETELSQGRLLLDVPDYPEALKRFDRAVDLCPGYASALFFRASAHEQLNQLPQAAADYDRAIALAPRCLPHHPNPVCDTLEHHPNWLYLSRGRVRVRLGELRGAIQDFDTALALDEPRAARGHAYYHRGMAYLELGDTEQGRSDLEQALDSIPADDTVRGAIRRRLAEASAGSR